MKRKINIGVIIVIGVLLILVLFWDVWMVFAQIQHRTKEAGISHLENISRELEESISDAEALTMEIALQAREFLGDRDALKEFFRDKKQKVINDGTGAFNVYIAGSDWCFIPDFDAPDGYVAQDRLWYKGAVRSGGKVYLSSPYQDAMTGNICYTVSVMLGDGRTVVAMDYTMDNVQKHVKQIFNEGRSRAVIVTDDGIIAGCSEDSMVGKRIVTAMPEFVGIWSLSKHKESFVTTRIKSYSLYDNIFAVKSGRSWILIVSISDRELYRTLYFQLFLTVFLLLAFIATVCAAHLFANNSKERSEENEPQGNSYWNNRKKQEGHGVNRQYRNSILVFMIIVMIFSLNTLLSATYRWGNAQMRNEAERYENSLSKWVDTQKDILDMFVSTISANPDMLKDYEKTVGFLDGITRQFPEISATYMASPDLKPSVYMNSGWKPESGWNVEERPWYIGAVVSKNGWSMTAPYYDDQTGGYCVTISEQVHDAKTGEFLGVFGIDFYMDKLVEILGGSYGSEGYAFLVDTEGYIVNHPYGKYQMSQDSRVSVLELPYGKVKKDGLDTRIIRDYDGTLKVLLATVNERSRFSVYVVTNAMQIYGRVLLYGVICLAAFLICIIFIYRLLSQMIAWQDKVNLTLEKAAKIDAMTGLLNKASAEEAISQAVKQGTGALLVIDLDSFKLVNDLYSHEMGDRLLIRFAELIHSVIRHNDIAGRIGGDEFVIFCEGLTDGDTILKKCAFLNSEIIRSARECLGSGMDIPIGCSAGAALAPQAGQEYNILFSKADFALHQIKKGGKHSARIYHDQETKQSEGNSSDLSNLRMIFGERNLKKTALVADRDLFQDVYRFMVRLASVNVWDLHLIEFTLRTEGKENLSACTDRFIELSANLLRNCDVILKYNDSQVIFLLMEPENRDFTIPVDRVLDAWAQKGVPGVTVSYQQEQVNER